MIFSYGLLVFVWLSANNCRSQNFPWNQASGLVLKIGHPILGPPRRDLEPDAYMRTEDIVRSYNYPIEIYKIVTSDGYVLTLHRIPHGKDRTSNPSNSSIIFISGIFTDGSSFIFNTAENSAAFNLADAGYDVWLLNFRGTFYSREHVRLNPDFHKKYWDFSFHEIGIYDLPATVDFVLKTTGHDQLYTLGYSMGGAITCIMLSEKPEYQRKVKASVLVAPAIRFRHPKFKIYYYFLKPLINIIGVIFDDREVLPKTPNMITLYQSFCGGIGRGICYAFIDLIFGYSPYQFNKTRIEVFMSHILSGTSMKLIKHYFQMYQGVFRKFDYGFRKNLKIHGQAVPPDYKLSAIRIPLVVIHGPGDAFVVSSDVVALGHRLQSTVKIIGIRHHYFNHLDFMCAKQVKRYFSDIVMHSLTEIKMESI